VRAASYVRCVTPSHSEFRKVATELPARWSALKRLCTAWPAAAGWVMRYHARKTTIAQPTAAGHAVHNLFGLLQQAGNSVATFLNSL